MAGQRWKSRVVQPGGEKLVQALEQQRSALKSSRETLQAGDYFGSRTKVQRLHDVMSYEIATLHRNTFLCNDDFPLLALQFHNFLAKRRHFRRLTDLIHI